MKEREKERKREKEKERDREREIKRERKRARATERAHAEKISQPRCSTIQGTPKHSMKDVPGHAPAKNVSLCLGRLICIIKI